jgi:conjugative transfer signal peptidase TraF
MLVFAAGHPPILGTRACISAIRCSWSGWRSPRPPATGPSPPAARARRSSQKPSSLAYTVWTIAATLWLVVQIAHAAGIRINHTPSLAVGFWRITPLGGPPRRGQIVSFCPPDGAALREARRRLYIGSGTCPGGYDPILKEVIAVAGDVVRLDAIGVAVNGRPLPRSRRLDTDAAGQPVPGIPHGR